MRSTLRVGCAASNAAMRWCTAWFLSGLMAKRMWTRSSTGARQPAASTPARTRSLARFFKHFSNSGHHLTGTPVVFGSHQHVPMHSHPVVGIGADRIARVVLKKVLQGRLE